MHSCEMPFVTISQGAFSGAVSDVIFMILCSTALSLCYLPCRRFVERLYEPSTEVAKPADSGVRSKLRARSWILSVFASAIMSIGGIFPTRDLVFDALILGRTTAYDLTLRDGNEYLSRYFCLFFAAFCFTDLVIGMVDYPSQLSLTTSWIHHSLYIFMCLWFVNVQTSLSLMIFASCEIPTFILAIGSVYSAWRHDYAFGITFLFTRIMLFAYIVQDVVWKAPWYRWGLAVFLLGLHLMWFADWTKGMIKRAKRKANPTDPSPAKSDLVEDVDIDADAQQRSPDVEKPSYKVAPYRERAKSERKPLPAKVD